MGTKKHQAGSLATCWSGIRGDLVRFCRSCEICRKTMRKGRVPTAPLQKLPFVDIPFKRLAVDIVGPIHPASVVGHRYILTIGDYATRHPEAIALKNVRTVAVAEALLEVYSRMGVPKEITEMGANLCQNAWQRCRDC